MSAAVLYNVLLEQWQSSCRCPSYAYTAKCSRRTELFRQASDVFRDAVLHTIKHISIVTISTEKYRKMNCQDIQQEMLGSSDNAKLMCITLH